MSNDVKIGHIYEIKDGPNRDALIDAFKYAYDKNARIPIDFDIILGYTTPPNNSGRACIIGKLQELRLVSVEHEDGSGDSFNLKGYCSIDLRIKLAKSKGSLTLDHRFMAYYNTKTRKGQLKFIAY